MKKLVKLFMLPLLVLTCGIVLTACGGGGDNSNNNQNNNGENNGGGNQGGNDIAQEWDKPTASAVRNLRVDTRYKAVNLQYDDPEFWGTGDWVCMEYTATDWEHSETSTMRGGNLISGLVNRQEYTFRIRLVTTAGPGEEAIIKATPALPNSENGLVYTAINNDTEWSVSGVDQTRYPEETKTLTVTIPSEYKGKPVTQIGSFSHASVTEITIPAHITDITENSYFFYMSNITKATIEKIIIPATMTNMSAWYNVPADLTIENCVWYYNPELNNLPQYIVDNLDEVIISPETTSINAATVDLLVNADIKFEGSVKMSLIISIGNNPSVSAKVKNIVIADTETTIDLSAFKNYTNLESLTIGAGILTVTVPSDVMLSSKLLNITVNANNTKYKAIDNVIYSKDGKKLVFYSRNKTNSLFTIPSGVETINDYAFQNISRKLGVIVPATITEINSRSLVSSYYTDLFYNGTVGSLTGAEYYSSQIYYFSETEPNYVIGTDPDTQEPIYDTNNYWRFDNDGVTPIDWKDYEEPIEIPAGYENLTDMFEKLKGNSARTITSETVGYMFPDDTIIEITKYDGTTMYSEATKKSDNSFVVATYYDENGDAWQKTFMNNTWTNEGQNAIYAGVLESKLLAEHRYEKDSVTGIYTATFDEPYSSEDFGVINSITIEIVDENTANITIDCEYPTTITVVFGNVTVTSPF